MICTIWQISGFMNSDEGSNKSSAEKFVEMDVVDMMNY